MIFIPNFVSVLANKIWNGFFVLMPGSCTRVGTWEHWACQGGHFFSSIVMQHMVKGQTGGIVVRSKGQISLNFHYKVNFKDIFTKFCVCSYNIYI